MTAAAIILWCIFLPALITQFFFNSHFDVLVNLSATGIMILDALRYARDSIILVAGLLLLGALVKWIIDILDPLEQAGDFVRIDPGQTISVRGDVDHD